MATTRCFSVRPCRAVLASSTAAGVLSGPFRSALFRSVPHDRHGQATCALFERPGEIGPVSLGGLGPVIGHRRDRYELNILGTEVVAAAVLLGADVPHDAPSPRLEEVLRRAARRVEALV